MSRSGIFDHFSAAVLGGGMTMTMGELPEIIPAARVTSEFFAVFGEQPVLGRTFSAEENQPGDRQSSSSVTACGRLDLAATEASLDDRCRSRGFSTA
jgi:hypothetical protein